jgi:hypothetical protein
MLACLEEAKRLCLWVAEARTLWPRGFWYLQPPRLKGILGSFDVSWRTIGAGIVLAKERILECLVPLTRYIQNLSKFRLAVQIV